MGRRKGFIPDQDARNKAMINNPTRREVITPLGRFESLKAAGREHGICSSLVKYYTDIGQKQRDGEIEINGKFNVTDYTGWVCLSTSKERKTQKVITPLGVFDSIKLAADAHNITSAAVIHKINTERLTEWQRL